MITTGRVTDFCHRLHLAEQVPFDQGIDKVPCSLALDKDPVTDCEVPLGETLEGYRGTHIRKYLDNFRGGLAVVNDDLRSLRGELVDARLFDNRGAE